MGLSTTRVYGSSSGESDLYGQELGYAEITADQTFTNTTYSSAALSAVGAKIAGLSITISGTGQTVDVEAVFPGIRHSVVSTPVNVALLINNVVTGGTFTAASSPSTSVNRSEPTLKRRLVLTNSVSYTFELGVWLGGAGTGTIFGSTDGPAYLTVTRR